MHHKNLESHLCAAIAYNIIRRKISLRFGVFEFALKHKNHGSTCTPIVFH